MLKRLARSLIGRQPSVARPGHDAPSLRMPLGVRAYAVGDVHGRRDLLVRMSDLIARDLDRASPGRAVLLFLGDYVDRGPDSRGVIDHLLSGSLPADPVFLRGNHEDMLLRFLIEPQIGPLWGRNGGIETLHSYGVDTSDMRAGRGLDAVARKLAVAMPAPHLEFLNGLALTYALGSFFFCHAGLRPGIPIEQQQAEDLLWIRDEFNDSSADFGCIVVHGHTPGEQPVVRPNRIGVDTGAYITGRLTSAVLDAAGVSFLST